MKALLAVIALLLAAPAAAADPTHMVPKISEGRIIAWPASNQPGRSPIRRSGLGADADVPCEIVVVTGDGDDAHAALSSDTTASAAVERRNGERGVMADSVEGLTSIACARSPPSDRLRRPRQNERR